MTRPDAERDARSRVSAQWIVASQDDYDRVSEAYSVALRELADARAENERLRAASRTHFRWAYAALLSLAKRRLADANADNEKAGTPDVWPAGQEWSDMVGSSHAIFMQGARVEAGIPRDEFLAPIRDGSIDVEDLCEAAVLAAPPAAPEPTKP